MNFPFDYVEQTPLKYLKGKKLVEKEHFAGKPKGIRQALIEGGL